MKLKEYILLIFSGLLFFGCSSDPEDKKPTALELLAGSYQTPFLQLDHANGPISIEANDSSSLNLNSDHTYTLFIKAALPNSDSVILIKQNGTYEIINSKYDKYVDQTIPIETLDGQIIFYPAGNNSWGGDFSFSFEMFTLNGYIEIEQIAFINLLWFKLSD